jgi:lysyl-tRNA synthetase class 2
MNDRTVWKPTCSIEMLQLRSRLLAAVRVFFTDRGYLEVETPLLSHDIVVDAHLEPFTIRQGAGDVPLYLQTSPEAGMKRLLAAGSGSIFQITRSFRRGERGSRHNPEFTMVEWYGLGTTYHQQMQFTQELIGAVVAAADSTEATAGWSQPFEILTYDEAFRRSMGCSVLDLDDIGLLELSVAADVLNYSSSPINRDDLLNLILSERVEPTLGLERPQFVCDYPISQAALAEQNAHDSRTACRFELYDRGLELCNGYQELTDPKELQRRDVIQNETRDDHGAEQLPGAPRMMAAMTAGLPQCSGVALGFDRLVMAIMQAESIDQVIPFPIEHA